MAGVRISELLLLADPELTDEIIINDLPSLVTKRTTLQAIRDLANQNIDDTETGSEVTGDLNVTGDITSENDIIFGGSITDGLGNSITDLDALATDDEVGTLIQEALSTILATDPDTGQVVTLNCIRDSSQTANGSPTRHEQNDPGFFGLGCGTRVLGELTVDSDLYVKGNIFTDGNIVAEGSITVDELIVNNPINGQVQFADSADHATRSQWSRRQKVSVASVFVPPESGPTEYVLFGPSLFGVDSVHTRAQFNFNPSTGVLQAPIFEGDGSLLQNVSAVSASAQTLAPKNTDDTAMFRVMLFPESSVDVVGTGDATDFDSAEIDASLRFNAQTNTLSGSQLYAGTSSELYVQGTTRLAERTIAQEAPGGSVLYFMLRQNGWTAGEDSDAVSVSSGVTFNTTNGTLNASSFSGSGFKLTNVYADSAGLSSTTKVNLGTTSGTYYLPLHQSAGGGQASYANNNLIFEHDTSSLNIGALSRTFDVIDNGNNSAYRFSDTNSIWFPTITDNPDLYLRRGEIYKFDVNAPGHPFWIKTSPTTGTSNGYNTGVVDNGTAVGTVIFKVPMEAPASLYYICQNHGSMVGNINIV